MAGESASEVARRQREKAARLERSAARWEQGAAGEKAVAEALAELPPDWTVINDVRWPGRRLANIDHVAVGPGGVFVIDAKNWSGRVEVVDEVLRQNGRQREAALAGGADAALAVAELAAVDPTIVQPVLCFARDEWVSGWARHVVVCSTFNLVAMLGSRPVVLSGEDLDSMRARVTGSLRSATGPAHPHSSSGRRMPVYRSMPKSPRSRSRRRAKSNGVLRFLAVILVGAVAVVGLPRLAPTVADIVTGVVIGGLVPRDAEIGSAVTVPADSTRPALQVTAVAVRSERAKGPKTAHAETVRLEFKNVGSSRYASGPELGVSLLDQEGVRRQPKLAATPFGRTLEGGLTLRPGKSVAGTVRFDLPTDARPTEVRVVVGSAPDETVDWTLPN